MFCKWDDVRSDMATDDKNVAIIRDQLFERREFVFGISAVLKERVSDGCVFRIHRKEPVYCIYKKSAGTGTERFQPFLSLRGLSSLLLPDV